MRLTPEQEALVTDLAGRELPRAVRKLVARVASGLLVEFGDSDSVREAAFGLMDEFDAWEHIREEATGGSDSV